MKKLLLLALLPIFAAAQIPVTLQKNPANGSNPNQLTAASNPILIGNGQKIQVLSGGLIEMLSGSTFTPAPGSNLVTTSGTYADPSWITSLAYSKLTGAPTGGTVSSVALTVPSGFSVSGSPVTSSGTLAVSFATGQAANNVLATPDNSSGALSIRSLVPRDIPSLTLAKISDAGTAASHAATDFATPQTSAAGYGITNGSNLDSWAARTQPASDVFASGTAGKVLATPSGSSGVPSVRALVASDIPSLTLSKISDASTLTLPFAQITSTPTSAAGYGIANGANLDVLATKTYPAGAVVGTTDAQTLTNKSIDAGQLTGTIAAGRLPSFTGDVTNSGAALTISAGSVGLSKMANLAAYSLIGNNTASALSPPIALTTAQAKTLLAISFGDVSGLGNSAPLDVGVVAGTVAAGDDPRFHLLFNTLGETIYAGTGGNPTILPPNNTTTRKFYAQTGNGTTSAPPSWVTVSPTDLPTPTPSTLGGVFSKAAIAHNFLTQVGTDGTISAAQPSAADLSNGTTGSGTAVLATSPTLITPALGTPTSGTLTNATGLPVSTGIVGLGTGVATALAVNVGTAGAPVVNGGALGTPSSGVATNLTGTATGLTAGTASAVPASGLTGTALASNVVTSSLTSAAAGTFKTGAFVAIPEPYGILYSASSWLDITAFTANGTTPAITSNHLVFTGGTNVPTKTLDYNYYTALAKWQMTETFTVGTLSSTSYGIGVGFRGTTVGGPNSLYAILDCTNTASSGKVVISLNLNGSISTWATSATALALTAGDSITITMTMVDDTVTVSAYDVTTGAVPVTVSYQMSWATTQLYNTGRFAIFNFGGTQTVTALSISSAETKNADVAVIGDSKTAGYGALAYGNPYPRLLQRYYKTITLAGTGDRTGDVLNRVSEIVNLSPRAVILCIGRNDLAAGIPSATWQANYASIVSQLQAAGIVVYHLLPLYETAISQAALTSWLQATYPAGNLIDAGLQRYSASPSTVLIDTIHPNVFGHRLIADAIVQSLPAPRSWANYDTITSSVRAPRNASLTLGTDFGPAMTIDPVTGGITINSALTSFTATGTNVISGITFANPSSTTMSVGNNKIYMFDTGSNSMKITPAGSLDIGFPNVLTTYSYYIYGLQVGNLTAVDSLTTSGGTAAYVTGHRILAPTFGATNTSVTTTDATTLQISDPIAGTNETIINKTSLWTLGNIRTDGAFVVLSGSNKAGGTVTLSSGVGTISSTKITTASVIILTRIVASGTATQPLVTASMGSASVDGAVTDNGTYNWAMMLLR